MIPFDVKTARINAGLSQRDLARDAGIPLVTVQNIERGLGSARPSNLKKLADFFEVKATDIVPVKEAA